jgi:hypothetical protein
MATQQQLTPAEFWAKHFPDAQEVASATFSLLLPRPIWFLRLPITAADFEFLCDHFGPFFAPNPWAEVLIAEVFFPFPWRF